MARLWCGVVAAASLAAAAPAGHAAPAGPPDAQLRAEYDAYVLRYGKHHGDGAREVYFAAFAANYRFIQAENAKNHTYKLGLNALTDLPKEYFIKTRFNHRAPPPPAPSALPWLGEHSRRLKALPDSMDWRQQGAVSPVRDQGDCGSCWSFSATGAIEGAWKIASGELKPLSQQQFVDCDFGRESIIGEILGGADWGCGGGEPYWAFDYAQQAALCTEESYPYTAQDPDTTAKASKTCAAHRSSCSVAIPKGAVTGYRTVSRFSDQALMDALALQPVSVSIAADADAFHHYQSGVLSASCGFLSLDHAVLLVGYGRDQGDAYWLVKNSWGTTWGENGYVRLSRTGAWGAGKCGIKESPHYPVVQQKGGALVV